MCSLQPHVSCLLPSFPNLSLSASPRCDLLPRPLFLSSPLLLSREHVPWCGRTFSGGGHVNEWGRCRRGTDDYLRYYRISWE
eukprot:759203-Hanusia_phi.AAC.3